MTTLATNCIQPDFKKGDGLVPAIVQEWNQGRGGAVLMLAYTNKEAFKLTLETRLAHFWSRSRGKLWKKGETSSNVLFIKQILIDCDQDSLLYLVTPTGPVCHTGERTCFNSVSR